MHETGVNFKRPQSINLHLTNHKMSSSSSSSLPDSVCANCDKGEECSGDLKSCTACQMVKYCNRDCQIAHRPQHKRACKKRAAELYDEQLFKEPPPRKECPICMLPSPLYDNDPGMTFHSCCGKSICNGCMHTMRETGIKNMKLCPFCKTPPPRSNLEEVNRVKKLMEKDNANAFYQLAGYYVQGIYGLTQDRAKANELWRKASELGCAEAYNRLGYSFSNGMGVEVDKKKATRLYELAAMKGDVRARHNVGALEGKTGNHHRAYKHFLISARAGYKESLDMVKYGYTEGHVTKEEYANTLRQYQMSQDEMNSEARDKALAARNYYST